MLASLGATVTFDLGPGHFASARRLARDVAAAHAAADRDAAFAALREARADFAAHAEDVYESGAQLAGRDADRLEQVAERLLNLVDELQPTFDRLDIAREVAGPAEARPDRISRSSWDRPALAASLCEAFEPLLSRTAAQVLSAAVRLEIRR
jgi:hypothetical protein